MSEKEQGKYHSAAARKVEKNKNIPQKNRRQKITYLYLAAKILKKEKN